MSSDPGKARRAASSQDYEALVLLSDELLGVVDPDGRILIRNPAWERRFDLPRAADIFAVIQPDDRETMRGALSRAFRGEPVPPVETRCRDRAGGACGVSWRLEARGDERLCLVAGRERRDDVMLTELGLVAAVIAHDFNNVLSVIRGCASMLRVAPGLTPAQARELDDLSGGVRHGMELVQQVFSHSRRKPPQPGGVDLNKVIAQMGWMLRRLGRKNIGVDLVLGRALSPVNAEEVQIEQVVLNLAVNARDAMPEGGRLLIETSDVPPDAACNPPLPPTASGGYVRLIVSDTGTGIPAEIQTRVFEPFFTTKRDGTGLGLFSVQRIVRQCGGHLRIRSQPRKGTTFEAYFPRTDATASRVPL